jgi:hyaluronan synthase
MLQYLAYIVIFGTIMQSYYWMKERDSDCIYGVLYSLFWFTCLWWVVPYSILTANNGKWGTRTVSACLSNGTAPEPQQQIEQPQRLAA